MGMCFVKKGLLLVLLGMFIASSCNAVKPLWTFTPSTPTTHTLLATQSVIVNYTIKNESKRTHTLIMQPISGARQLFNSKTCAASFKLNYQDSCTLSLFIDGSRLERDIKQGPIVCQQAPEGISDSSQCYQPSAINSLNITADPCVQGKVGSVTQLLRCIRGDDLWQHLVRFQQISDNNPDPTFARFPGAPHGSRDSGTQGDIASVNYLSQVMKSAGYKVTIQSYPVLYNAERAVSILEEISPTNHSYIALSDFWYTGPSGSGNITTQLEPAGSTQGAIPDAIKGCKTQDFLGFHSGRIALIENGLCDYSLKAHNAQNAGASGVLIFKEHISSLETSQHSHKKKWRESNNKNQLAVLPNIKIPVATLTYNVGSDLLNKTKSSPVTMHLFMDVLNEIRTTYNVIADSPYGDKNHVVVVDAHYDSIYGAGILDNASGSATILEIALKMKQTPTINQLRYIWFGGEELGIFGSQFYLNHLKALELNKIVFDVDADVTATQNYETGIADPANASNASVVFPPNVIPASELGNNYFRHYFHSIGLPYTDLDNEGTDSYSFAQSGIPNTGILTGQNCCKTQELINLFGGYLGNFEGNIPRNIPLDISPPNEDEGCVDMPYRFCDNLRNNDRHVIEFISKATAYVVYQLANNTSLGAS
ncbi:MAG: M28 family peptidase [bacterium]|nr:M28 family peptidase [bacterium]